eukprot:2860235-Karenia_brevis.AAC.1
MAWNNWGSNSWQPRYGKGNGQGSEGKGYGKGWNQWRIGPPRQYAPYAGTNNNGDQNVLGPFSKMMGQAKNFMGEVQALGDMSIFATNMAKVAAGTGLMSSNNQSEGHVSNAPMGSKDPA